MLVLLVSLGEALTAQAAQLLTAAEFAVESAPDAFSALMRLGTQMFDVMIIDGQVLDPGSARYLANEASNQDLPILAVLEQPGGAPLVARDWFARPVADSELVPRTAALPRKTPSADEQPLLKCGDLELHRLEYKVRYRGVPIDLPTQEFRLLEYLMLFVDLNLTRSMLLQRVWSPEAAPRTNIVEQHMSRLRAKLNRAGAPPLIRTIRGVGYRLSAANRPAI